MDPQFLQWIKFHNPLLNYLYLEFITICKKNGITIYNDKDSKKKFCYMIYNSTEDAYKYVNKDDYRYLFNRFGM
jgi:hypothetical protein